MISKGIDVSKWQKDIDFDQVRDDGIEFVMIRASYGRNTSGYVNKGIDEKFETNYKDAKAAGLKVGAYHYCYAKNVNQAVAEANFFVSRLKNKTFEYPVVLDIEDKRYLDMSNKLVTDIAKAFLEYLEGEGYFAMIYSYRYFFQHYINDHDLTDYAHWVAEYNSTLKYKGDYGIWQYTSKGSVKGINTYVDLNRCYVDYPSIIVSNGLNGFSEKAKDEKVQYKKLLTYTIKSGDTLTKIARRFNSTVDSIAKVNNIKNKNLIYPGDKIIVPVKENVTVYTVKRGDTLSKIALEYKTTVSKLVKDNNIENPNLIYPGQLIKIIK